MFWTSFIAWKYFKSSKKDNHVNLATNVSIFTSTLTIICLILSFAIFRGYNNAIVEKLARTTGHIVISDAEPFDPKPILDSTKLKHEKIVESYGMIASGSHSMTTLITSSSAKNVRRNGISSTGNTPIIINESLAKEMHYKPSDIINVIIPTLLPAPALLATENITCEIIAIAKNAEDEFNENVITMNITDLQKILNHPDKVHKIKLFSKSINDIDSDFSTARKQISDKNVYHWRELNEFILKMIKSEQNIFIILLFLLILLSSFLYTLAIAMFINSKKRDIRILKILGANNKNIHSIFLQYSLILYTTNLIIGSIIGIFLAKNINRIIQFIERKFQIILFTPETYLINYIPTQLNVLDLSMILGFLFLISLISSLWISRKMSSIDVFKNL